MAATASAWHAVPEVGATSPDLAAARPLANTLRSGADQVARPRQAGSMPAWVSHYVRVVPALDFMIAFLSGAVALLLRFGFDLSAEPWMYVLATVAFPVALVATFALCRCYERRFVAEGPEEYRRLGQAALRFTAAFAMVCFAFRLDFARSYALVALPLTVLLCIAVRALARWQLRRLRRSGLARHRVLVLGTERASAEMIRMLAKQADSPYQVVGILTDLHRDDHVEGVPVVGSTADARIATERHRAATIMVAPWSPLSQQQLRRLSWDVADRGVDLMVSPNLADVTSPRIHIQPVAGMPLLHIEQPEFSGARRVMKSAFDTMVALGLLVVFAPLLLGLAAVVGLSTPGGALFRQERVGRDGRLFTMYKFRSMHLDAEARLADLGLQNVHGDGPLFKMQDDPRITRVGRWMRRFSLDELPQLLNVVKGDMSMVGPRPPLPDEVARYEGDVHRRMLVRPGLTGLWQVSGRSDLSWDESVRLDIYYVENWTVFFDLAILARTASAVLRARGAY